MGPFRAKNRREHGLFAAAVDDAPLVFGVNRRLCCRNQPGPHPNTVCTECERSGNTAPVRDTAGSKHQGG
jgi:hypothetical protein